MAAIGQHYAQVAVKQETGAHVVEGRRVNINPVQYVVDNLTSDNTAGNPTLAAYLALEKAAGYVVVSLTSSAVVTADASAL